MTAVLNRIVPVKRGGFSYMDIRDYEYIVAIAEQGSITRAAAHLFIT